MVGMGLEWPNSFAGYGRDAAGGPQRVGDGLEWPIGALIGISRFGKQVFGNKLLVI